MKKEVKILIQLFIFIAFVTSIHGGNDNKDKTLPVKYISYDMSFDKGPLKAFEFPS